jgi:hypothetical protein
MKRQLAIVLHQAADRLINMQCIHVRDVMVSKPGFVWPVYFLGILPCWAAEFTRRRRITRDHQDETASFSCSCSLCAPIFISATRRSLVPTAL